MESKRKERENQEREGQESKKTGPRGPRAEREPRESMAEWQGRNESRGRKAHELEKLEKFRAGSMVRRAERSRMPAQAL